MASDISKKGIEELKKNLADMREQLRSFRFGGAGTRARNTREGRNLRKTIARTLTELNNRKIDSAKKIA